MQLTPVDHNPFETTGVASPPSNGGLVPVDYDPFAQSSQPKVDLPLNTSNDASMGEQLARQLGLTGRYMIEGAGSLATGVGDLANTGINKLSEGLNKYAGTNIPSLGMPSEDLSNALTKVGYPSPESGIEKGVATASKLAAGLMPMGESLVSTGKQAIDNIGEIMNKPNFPTTSDAAKKVASQFYTEATNTGGVLKPEITNEFINKIEKLAPQTIQGKAFAGETQLTKLVERAQALRGQPLSLPAIQEIDEHLGNLIDDQYTIKGLSKEGKQFLDLQKTLRNTVHDAGPIDIVGGTGGFDALRDGRKAWSQASKMQDIERIQLRASQSDNPATTIKAGVRTLLSNASKTRGWTDQEIAALKAAGDRGALGGTLHVFGSRLMPFAGTMIGESVGGLPGAAIGAALGHGGSTVLRNAASSLQGKRLSNVLKTMGKGVPK